MDIRITHCAVCWGYRDRAIVLAGALRERFGAEVEVVEGTLGQFDVQVDGRLVWSRGKTVLARMKPPRFPEAARVIASIEEYLPAEEAASDRSKPTGREFGPSEAKRFYDRFGSKQDLQFYERRALRQLVDHADFEHASSVFELGCGTGRLAADLLRDHLAEDARYFGVDISTTIIGIAERRLAPWSERVTVQQADGTSNTAYPDACFERFVATYVLDLLSEDAIHSVLVEANRLLARNGKLCLVTSTEGTGAFSRVLSSMWKRIYAFNPRLVGGCRPLRVSALLDATVWRIEHVEIVSSWGICSEILIAAPV